MAANPPPLSPTEVAEIILDAKSAARFGSYYDKQLVDCATLFPDLDRLAAHCAALSERANEGFAAHAVSFGALAQIALLLNQDDVDDYQDVVKGVAALSERCEEAERRARELQDRIDNALAC